jgi:hypothetical protein
LGVPIISEEQFLSMINWLFKNFMI